VKILLEALSETWRPIVKVAFEIRGRETRPQMLQVAAPNETVVAIAFDMAVGDARGTVNLCLPATIVETAGGHFARAWHRQRREPTAIERKWVHDHLARTFMPVSASIESRLTTRDLLDIKCGDVVSLGVPAHRLVDVHVGRTLKFKGRMAIDEGRVGVHIEQHCSGASRVEG
jgi:flagellar motor switch protein FliM